MRGRTRPPARRFSRWPTRDRQGRLRRAILWVAGSAALGFLCLVGATNLVLRSDWLSGQINSDPATLFVTYSGARSLVPGHLRFDTLVLRSRDSNIEWEARLEGVSVRVGLSDLLSRHFRADSVRADALSFRLRERLDRPEATSARLARYPRIVGFGDPPLRDPPAPPVPPGDPWRVVVDDLSVGLVREIWIDSWRWTGAARVRGGLFLRSGLEAEVFPSELVIARGTLHWGEETVSRETAGSVRATLPRFDTQAYPGNDVWKIMSGGASLRGSLDALAFLAPAGDGPRLAPGGAGTVRARVALRDGRGSARLDAEASAVVVKLGKRRLRGAVRANVFARRIDFPGGSVAFDGTRVRLQDVSLEDVTDPPWSGAIETRQARLGLTDGSLDARLSARLGDGRPLVALVPAGPPKWIAGLLDLRDFEASGRLRASRGFLALSPARAEAGTFSIDADWREARGRSWGALLVRKSALSLGVGIGESGTSLHLVGAAGWFAEEGRPGGRRTDQPRGSGAPVGTGK
ncbi:MAG: hypothetical protein ACHQM4_04300 [Thermoanaerobaculia bacterium]